MWFLSMVSLIRSENCVHDAIEMTFMALRSYPVTVVSPAANLAWSDAPESLRSATYYAVSDNDWSYRSLDNARRDLGYEPQDPAEQHR